MADAPEAKKNPEYEAPAIDWESRAYWEGCGRGELVLQRCRACKTVQHRPRGLCATCLADDIEDFVASGRGEVYTYSVVRQNQMPAFAAESDENFTLRPWSVLLASSSIVSPGPLTSHCR